MDKTLSVHLQEIVLFRGEAARISHKTLFSLADASYVSIGEDLQGSILSAARSGVTKLHIAGDWETILETAVWISGRPETHDVLALIKKSGITDEEIAPFKNADINDIFPWLYYSKRFDILRKICNAAKARAESKTDRKNLMVYCHLVSGETGKIAASSL